MTITAPPPDDVVYTVTQLNGHTMDVMTEEEMRFYVGLQQGYLSENTFTNTSDLADLDRLISYELQVFRMNRWLAAGRDYEGKIVGLSHMTELRRQAKEIAALINGVKTDLGLTRSAREKEQHESVGSYLVELKKRAKEQGVKRERELGRALVLGHELISLVETYDRSNDTERLKLGLDSEADIVEWLRMKFIPEFRAVDEHFRTHQQKYWVGTL